MRFRGNHERRSAGIQAADNNRQQNGNAWLTAARHKTP
jgi:hypothetical protein